MKTFLLAMTAALLMSGSLACADNPVVPSEARSRALAVSDDGYVPPEVIAAQRRATELRQQQRAAARPAVADVGYVPPDVVAAQRLATSLRQQRSAPGRRAVADVGYVPPEYLAEQRRAALREERRLERRLMALRQARRSFQRPVADVGYVPPEVTDAQRLTTLNREKATAADLAVPAAVAHGPHIQE